MPTWRRRRLLILLLWIESYGRTSPSIRDTLARISTFATVTEEQLPELKRRAELAKEEHERAMAEKRERIAAQEQATLDREIAVEELRLQRLRMREETERTEGPFNREARESSRDRQRRSDAEAARRVAAATAYESWVDVATATGRRPRSPSRAAKGRGKTKDKDRDASPDDDSVDMSQRGRYGRYQRERQRGLTPQLDRLGRLDVSYRGCPFQFLPPGARPGEISAVAISR